MIIRKATRFTVGKPDEVTVYPNLDKDVSVQIGKLHLSVKSDSPVTLQRIKPT